MANKSRPIPPELLNEQSEDFFDAINNGTSLACVLISTSYCEQLLGTLLHQFFINGETSDGLLRHDGGLLGELFARARLAYCVSLIDKVLFANIGRIGEIRNIFAHSHLHVDFDDPLVAAKCKDLILPIVASFTAVDESGVRMIDQSPFDDYGPRDRFQLTAVVTTQRLMLKTLHVKRCGTAGGPDEAGKWPLVSKAQPDDPSGPP